MEEIVIETLENFKIQVEEMITYLRVSPSLNQLTDGANAIESAESLLEELDELVNELSNEDEE